MADDIADFVAGKPRIDRNRQVVKPEFCFMPSCPDVDVRRLISLVGIEKGSIRTPP
jgi:hypothetical protein